MALVIHTVEVSFCLTAQSEFLTLRAMSDPQINVVQLREALGWTQQQLATACGVDRSTVSKWESEPPTKGPALILLRQLQERAGAIPPSVAFGDTSLPDGVADGRQTAEAAE